MGKWYGHLGFVHLRKGHFLFLSVIICETFPISDKRVSIPLRLADSLFKKEIFIRCRVPLITIQTNAFQFFYS
ncbi:hypothetical protein PUN28_013631 [Cardiocondyla obscurior]|uniref:Uncharacterized protein n=1 Tax=Cardiocondyla obscurior TaxID=286306 RepID=A0AAW2F842_9HYME